MKENRILYSITTLAMIGILVSFIGYATDTPVETKAKHPLAKTFASAKSTPSTPSVTPSKTTTPSTTAESSCGCCAERKALARKKNEAARARRLARQSVTTDNTKHE